MPPENKFLPTETAHSICVTDEYRHDGKKLRARTCAVCSWRYKQKQMKRANVTTKYCTKCSKSMPNEKRVFLCTEQRHDLNNNSCFTIWHSFWKCKQPPMGELQTYYDKVNRKNESNQVDQDDKRTDNECSDDEEVANQDGSSTESEHDNNDPNDSSSEE